MLCIIIFLLPSQISSFLTLEITSAFSSIAISLPVMNFSPLSLSCWIPESGSLSFISCSCQNSFLPPLPHFFSLFFFSICYKVNDSWGGGNELPFFGIKRKILVFSTVLFCFLFVAGSSR